jgi:hypothetical protein
MSANVQLSAEEMALVTNAEWILTKNAVIGKVYAIFGELSALQREAATAGLPPEVWTPGPKIARGEQYRGLPWVMLDYPRCFKGDEAFAIRSFFWWGHYFSVSLHLGGVYKQRYAAGLLAQWERLQQEGYWICTGEDAWQHHTGPDNYHLAAETERADWEKHLQNKSFLKIARLLPFGQWETATKKLFNFYEEMLSILARC